MPPPGESLCPPLTRAQRGISVAAGTKAYFGIAEVLSPLREIDKWVRRKLRCSLQALVSERRCYISVKGDAPPASRLRVPCLA